MRRDHLSPEQRPTKNGNIVTRWVKTRDMKKATPSSTLPAPGIAALATDYNNPSLEPSTDPVYTVEPDDQVLIEYTIEPPDQIPSTLKTQNINW